MGIHTGSSSALKNPADDTGYVVSSSMLRVLVKAYHNNGRAVFPVLLNAVRITQINVDEFISYAELMDEQGRVLWHRSFEGRYSSRQIEAQLNLLPSVRYIKLGIGKTSWSQPFGAFGPATVMKESQNIRTVWFDWKQGKEIEKILF